MSAPTQKVGRNTRLRFVFLPTLLSCYRRFVRALHLNTGGQSKLLYYLTGLCGNMLLILLVSRKCVTEEPTKSPFHNTVLCNPIVDTVEHWSLGTESLSLCHAWQSRQE